MRHSVRWLILVLLIAAAPLRAQRGPAVHVDLSSTLTPMVSVTHVLDDRQLQELMRNGFGVELHFRLELWRTGGLFNDLERSTKWDVLVQSDPSASRQIFRVRRSDSTQTEDFGRVPSLDSAQALLARPYAVRLPPGRPGVRYYYNVVLDVESLNASDLNELERWLHGDVQPAVRGRSNPLSALKNGIGRLMSRALGGTKRSYEATSPTFVAPAR